MARVTGFLFGLLMPSLEVLLVLSGLGLMGWQGVVYTSTGVWPRVSVSALGLAAHGSGALIDWLASVPLSGACFVTAAVLFFVMPPAYAHG